jgi:hypothetical protein
MLTMSRSYAVLLAAIAGLWGSRAAAQGCTPPQAIAAKATAATTTALARAILADTIQVLINSDPSPIADAQTAAGTEWTCLRIFLDDPLQVTGTADRPMYVPSNDVLRNVYNAVLAKVKAREVRPLVAAAATAQAASIAGVATGLPSQADLLNGIFEYLRGRAEDELIYATLGELRTLVHSTTRDGVVLQALLPRSIRVLDQLDHMSVRQLLPSLRTAALSDLDGAPKALVGPPIVSLGACAPADAACQTKRDIFQTLSRMVTVLDALRNGQPPVSALGTLANTTTDDVTSDDVRLPLRLAGTLAREYNQAGQKGRQKLNEHADLQRYFVAFVLDDAVLHGGYTGTTVAAVVGRIQAYVRDADIGVGTLFTEVRTLDSTIAKLSDPSVAKSDTARANMIATSIALSTHVIVTALQLGGEQDAKLVATANTVVFILDDADDLFRAAVAHDYVRVVVSAVTIVDTVAGGDAWGQAALRYVTVAADLATAKSTTEVQQVLTDVALPVGSSRLKRGGNNGHARSTFTLNAYFGGAVAREIGQTRGVPRAPATAIGFTVPIGPEYAIGFKGGAISLFVPVVDLGVLTSYRVASSDTLKSNPTISWSQVLAPGVDLMLGITQKFPVSFGLGAQYAPGLRRARTTNTSVDVIRYQALLAVDMPLLRF